MERRITFFNRKSSSHPAIKGGLTILFAAIALSGSAEEREVTVKNPKDGITLAGTLSAPSSSPKAAILLASGSGPQNRDEEIMGLKPFKVLSDSLTAAGYAVLRMDDRGTAGSGGDFQAATATDFIGDICASLSFLDSCYTSIPKGIIGHSEGGQLAIRIAAQAKNDSTSLSSSPDFIITLAAPSWRGDSLIMSQARALSTAMTGSWPGEAMQREILDIAQGPLPTSIASPLVYAIISKELGEAAQLPQVSKQINTQVSAVLSPYYREMLRYDPEDDIKAVDIPWLALNGDKDLQVLPDNLKTIAGQNPSASVVLLPGLNHLFQRASSRLPAEYPSAGQSPASGVTSAIITWLDSVTGKGK